MNTIRVEPIRALKDNYVWAIVDSEQHAAIIVDPGEAMPVIDFLDKQKLSLRAILITHHHWDHVNGIAEILAQHNAPVYGPANEDIPHLTHPLSSATTVNINGFPELKVLEIPGHTSGHIAYYAPDMLFCGDTLFAAGCGRIFEGTAAQMYDSLQKIAALPAHTGIYCGHEYTLNNLRFAQTVEPDNKNIAERIKQVTELRDNHLPSLPSLLSEELTTNPFLRCDSFDIKATLEKQHSTELQDPVAVFAVLRKLKDRF